MPGEITFQGNSLTLVGRILKDGTTGPDFIVTSQDLKEVRLSDFPEKIKIITSFPSLDTPVCDLQVKEFNKKASSFSKEVIILAISKDLPFAQKRFCRENDINNISVLSDYKTSSFGINYGLLIKELNLLARSVLILDKNNSIRYRQVVGELTQPPDYNKALDNLKEVISNPQITLKEEFSSKCKPCEGGVLALPRDKIDALLAKYKGWELIDGKKLVKEFKFKDFVEAKYFLDLVSVIAEEQGHHPNLTLIYNKLKISLTTHAVSGLTENDFIMATIIDELG